MKKHILDFAVLFVLELLFAYLFCMVIFNGADIVDISLAPYLGLSLAIIIGIQRTILKLKKEKMYIVTYSILSILSIFILYIYLFQYYNYDILHEKSIWWFGLYFAFKLIGEFLNHFWSYEQLKKNYDMNLNSFKKRDISIDTDKKIEEDKEVKR